MREDFVHGATPRRAVIVGFEHGSRVVLAAAIIRASVFVAFVFGGRTAIAPTAFALGVGILVDALIVRMTLVPAVMTLLGHSAWWLPRWLDRIVPYVDIEGERLTRHLAEAQER